MTTTAIVLTAALQILHLSYSVAANSKPEVIPAGKSCANQLMPRNQLPKYEAPTSNLKTIRHEDMERKQLGLPERFAITNTIPGDYFSNAAWETVDDGRQALRQEVDATHGFDEANGCKNLNFHFKPYIMPPGCNLTIYDPEVDEMMIGPFTDKHNNVHGEFFTIIVNSCDVIIEVDIPPGVDKSDVNVVLHSVNVGYKGFGVSTTTTSEQPQDDGVDVVGLGRNLASPCNINAECHPEWDLEQRSVAAISLGGSLFCTGFMVNNVEQDFTPYFMTAHHCGISESNAASLVTYWNWKYDKCEEGTLTYHHDQFVSGAVFLASYPLADAVLVRLTSSPDSSWGVTYAGWDSSGKDANNVVAVHHPHVDDGMKISFQIGETLTTSWSGSTSPGDGSHIKVPSWYNGTTEPGSSGSPLFDSEHRVIGQLHGGAAACGNYLPDWYGKFSASFHDGEFRRWLDPKNKGTTTVDTIKESKNCGNGNLDPPEACDGNDFGGKTCADYGFLSGGALSCSQQCQVITDNCANGCGNDVREDNEICDGDDLDGTACANLGYTSGDLSCKQDCSGYDTTQCESILYGPQSISARQGDEISFCVDVATDISSLKFFMSGGNGDGDLLVRRGYSPTAQDHDCMPYLYGNDEQCTYESAIQGKYCAVVHGYTSFEATLVVKTPDAIAVGCSSDGECDDGIPCTVDTCNMETGLCENTPDDSVCDDKLFCTGTETCDVTYGCQTGRNPCPDFGSTCDEEEGGRCLTCSVMETFDDSTFGRTAGWSTNGSTCKTGSFVVGRPNKVTSRGVRTQVDGDHTTGSGYALYSSPNLRKGSHDIDKGTCIVKSPTYEVKEKSLLGIWYFFGQRNARDDPEDGFKIELIITGSTTETISLVEIGDKRNHARWTYASEIIPANSKVQINVEATDGERRGDFIEAGIDDLTICPISY
eukprot:CAMPEP_0185724850 /NCGR_PEP_ID=MMETSP1171-20130828/1220_1 /TAXON_ID=374046 /ORGANISM="Helicotheca tamensis, Strain CCMP826" /LENGTH=932 /DNA_ID=CAMNT_0028392799 /DNA_START=71 /DNA_END=2869 /DNA_ORIENTATION=-